MIGNESERHAMRRMDLSMRDRSELARERLANLLEFETLISDLSSRFINLPAGEVDREIQGALRRVCDFLGVELAVIWQWSSVVPGTGAFSATHFHYSEEGRQPPETLCQEKFPWYVGQMLAGRTVIHRSLDEFSTEATVDRESARRLGIVSSLCLPLALGGEPLVGALAFNSLCEEREWPDAVVKRLRLVAQVFTNALARKRHESSLQESEERLALAADSAEAGLWTLDCLTGTFWATARHRAIFGHALDEVIDLGHLESSIHPEDWKRVRDAFDHSRRFGDPIDIEFRTMPDRDGAVRWITSRGRPHCDSAGEVERLMGLSIDVTERKRGDEALRAYEARLEAGSDLAGLGFYEVDYVEQTAFLDARLRGLLGLPPDRAQDLQPVEFLLQRVHSEDRESFLEQRQQLDDGRLDEVSVEYRLVLPTRGTRWMHHMARVAERDGEGRALKAHGVIRDVTERREREDALRQSLEEIARLKDRLQAETDYLKAEIKVVHAHGEVTGKSAAIQKVLGLLEQVAPTDSSVLVCGETGTGKELVAQAIHRLSSRASRVMVKVNCAALPSGLVESELFGREKGAFTGAMTRQFGRFEAADGSTLFLDEIGELPLDVQAKLLRVLETGEFERLGSPKTHKVNVRVIAATHRDLAEDVRKGRFREDLYYRINVFPIRVPPLRERVEDIPLLVWAFLEEFSSRMGKRITQVPRGTMEALQRCAWPGNVRELKNVIERAAIVTTGETLRVPMLEDAPLLEARPTTLADSEREIILRTLEITRGRIKGPKGAAAALGLNPSTLYGRMKKLGIRSPGSADER
jgi:formate hydrogenlyase transcriptional activator